MRILIALSVYLLTSALAVAAEESKKQVYLTPEQAGIVGKIMGEYQSASHGRK